MRRGTKRTNTSPTLLLLDSWGLLGQESRQSLFDVSAKLFQVFLTAAVKCWKPAPVTTHTTCPEPYRNLKQVRVSLQLRVEVEVRHIDRAMAMAQSAPKSLHTSHISEHLYTAHTLTHTATYMWWWWPSWPALSKVLEMKPKQRPKRTKNVKQ